VSDPTGTINDGGIALIEQTVSLLNNAASPVSTDYILRRCSLKEGTKRIVSTNQNDVETKQRFSRMIATGSGTLQLINATDLPPSNLQRFTATTASGATQKLILHGVGSEFGAGEEVQIPIEIAIEKNPTSGTEGKY
jgi:hypothetical protein